MTRRDQDRIHVRQMAFFVPLLCVLFTLGIYAMMSHNTAQRDRARFDSEADDTVRAVLQRMEIYIDALRASAGLFAASREVTRDEWHAYVSSLDLKDRYPGIQGLGFAQHVSASVVPALEASIRHAGFPTFRVRPTYQRSEYYPIVFLEPMDARNRRAFGYDMATNPVRREAMERARDTGKPAMSGRVRLVQETGVDLQAGFLIYLPVYAHGASTATVSERRAALEGFVYAPFRARNLFQGIFTSHEMEPAIDFEIFEGPVATAQTLLYDHNPTYFTADYHPGFSTTRHVMLAGRTWTMRFVSLPGFDQESHARWPVFVLLAGLLISSLIFWITWILATRQERAVALASEMTAELRQADQAKDEFLSVISHELRTPLNFIMGFASILDDEVAGPLSPVQHEYMGKILNGVDRMLMLVNDLLDFAKIQAGKLTLSPRPTAFAPLVNEVVSTMGPLAAQKHLTLEATSLPDVTLTVDGPRIIQVLTNLVGNAIKFTHPGGRITVSSEFVGDDLVTKVSDTGVGIAERDLPKLFTRFKQLDMSATRAAGGTGLGLSISKGLVEAQGGQIGVTSTPGVGSTFWFSLPMRGPR